MLESNAIDDEYQGILLENPGNWGLKSKTLKSKKRSRRSRKHRYACPSLIPIEEVEELWNEEEFDEEDDEELDERFPEREYEADYEIKQHVPSNSAPAAQEASLSCDDTPVSNLFHTVGHFMKLDKPTTKKMRRGPVPCTIDDVSFSFNNMTVDMTPEAEDLSQLFGSFAQNALSFNPEKHELSDFFSAPVPEPAPMALDDDMEMFYSMWDGGSCSGSAILNAQQHTPVRRNSMSKRDKTIALSAGIDYVDSSVAVRQQNVSVSSIVSVGLSSDVTQNDNNNNSVSHQQQILQVPQHAQQQMQQVSQIIPAQVQQTLPQNTQGSLQKTHQNPQPFKETVIDLSSFKPSKPQSRTLSQSGIIDFTLNNKHQKKSKTITYLNGSMMARTRLFSPTSKKSKPPSNFSCTFCPATFKAKGYLARHLRSHSSMKQYVCPFYRPDQNSEPSRKSVPLHTNRGIKKSYMMGSSCHPSGGFNRKDSYKTHLKAIHFIYPAGTKPNDRNDVAGRCAGCMQFFENNSLWLDNHIETGVCEVIRRNEN